MTHSLTSNPLPARRIVVAMSGASGAILGIRLLQVLAQDDDSETHLIISPAARQTIEAETDWAVRDVEALADVVHGYREIGASIASGSFETHGMVIVPCSVKTLSSIAYGITGDLITRAADVALKEGRTLIAVFRETPLHVGHIRAMLAFAQMGGVVFPPMPAFYARPETLDDVVDEIVGRVLNRLGIENELYTRWTGLREAVRGGDDE
jgi:4-hydroxy-3-polyprenylbenzoate decarboxylase